MKKFYFSMLIVGSSLGMSAQIELITNGGFENGSQGWVIETDGNDVFADFGICDPYEGDNYLWFGDYDEETGVADMIESTAFQTVTIPANATSCTLSFYYSVTSDEQDIIEEYDYLYISLIDEAQDIDLFNDEAYLSNTDADENLLVNDCDEWQWSETVSIPSSYFGIPLTLAFSADSDETYNTIFRIDQVSMIAQVSTLTNELNSTSWINCSFSPISNSLKVNNSFKESQDISVFTIDGKLVLSESATPGTTLIDLSQLSEGLYIVQGNLLQPYKFVKTK